MIIKVKVHPGAKEEKVERVNSGLVIHVKERAEEGKANRKMVKLLAQELGVSWKAIKIKNPRSRDKMVEITQGAEK